MKTTINHTFFLSGDDIPGRPEKGTFCYRCDKDMGQDDKHTKIATLIAKKDDELIIHWDWFCSKCSEKFKNLLEEVSRDT